MFLSFRRIFLGIALYLKYMHGRRVKYYGGSGGGVVGYGPHALGVNWEENLRKLRRIGIGEIHKHWSFSTPFDNLKVWTRPTVSVLDRQHVELARELGMRLTAQIRWNPTPESLGISRRYPFWWWSGFVDLPQSDMGEFVKLNEEFIEELHESIRPDELIIAHEAAQLIQAPSWVWRELIREVKKRGIKVAVALNSWQPLKMDPLVRAFTRGIDPEKFANFLFELLRLPYPRGVKMDYGKLLAELPQWLSEVDSIGVDMYHYPTFNQRDPGRIRRAYSPMLANLRALSTRFGRPVSCTETGLELESGVDRSIETATSWWKETFDFWFFGVKVKRVLVWEHDLDFFCKIVENIGGLEHWLS